MNTVKGNRNWMRARESLLASLRLAGSFTAGPLLCWVFGSRRVAPRALRVDRATTQSARLAR
ncbi:hypothetical protein AB0P45_36815 [Streptomyces niveus]